MRGVQPARCLVESLIMPGNPGVAVDVVENQQRDQQGGNTELEDGERSPELLDQQKQEQDKQQQHEGCDPETHQGQAEDVNIHFHAEHRRGHCTRLPATSRSDSIRRTIPAGPRRSALLTVSRTRPRLMTETPASSKKPLRAYSA